MEKNFPVLLNVRGTRCSISTSLLRKLPESVVTTMFTRSLPRPPPVHMISPKPPSPRKTNRTSHKNGDINKSTPASPNGVETNAAATDDGNIFPSLSPFPLSQGDELELTESLEQINEEPEANMIPYGDFVEDGLDPIEEEYFNFVDFDYKSLRFYVLYLYENHQTKDMYVVLKPDSVMPTDGDNGLSQHNKDSELKNADATTATSTAKSEKIETHLESRTSNASRKTTKNKKESGWIFNRISRAFSKSESRKRSLQNPTHYDHDMRASAHVTIPTLQRGPKCILREDLHYYVFPNVKPYDRLENSTISRKNSNLLRHLSSRRISSSSSKFASNTALAQEMEKELQSIIAPIFKQVRNYCGGILTDKVNPQQKYSEQACNMFTQISMTNLPKSPNASETDVKKKLHRSNSSQLRLAKENSNMLSQLIETLKIFTGYEDGHTWQFREQEERINRISSIHITNLKSDDQIQIALDAITQSPSSPVQKESPQSPLAPTVLPLFPEIAPTQLTPVTILQSPAQPNTNTSAPSSSNNTNSSDSNPPSIIASVNPVSSMNYGIYQNILARRPFRKTWWECVSIPIDLMDFNHNHQQNTNSTQPVQNQESSELRPVEKTLSDVGEEPTHPATNSEASKPVTSGNTGTMDPSSSGNATAFTTNTSLIDSKFQQATTSTSETTSTSTTPTEITTISNTLNNTPGTNNLPRRASDSAGRKLSSLLTNRRFSRRFSEANYRTDENKVPDKPSTPRTRTVYVKVWLRRSWTFEFFHV